MCVGLNAMIWLGAPIRINIIVFEKPGLCIKKAQLPQCKPVLCLKLCRAVNGYGSYVRWHICQIHNSDL